MSGCARNIFDEEEDFQVGLGKGNPGWMARWTRASSSAYGKNCSPFEEANNSTCTKDSGASLFELKKSSMAERFMLGGNYQGISMENMQQLNSNMWGVGDDVCQEAEQKKIEQQDVSFQISPMQMLRDRSFYAKRVVSETLSVCRLPDLPLTFQKLVNSDENLDSHWNQFSMLPINQKIDRIFNPKRKYATGTVFDDLFVPQQTPILNVAPSDLMELSHQEYELQSHRKTDRVRDHCKPAGGIIRLREDPTWITSDHAGKKLKVDNNSLLDCLIDEQDAGHYFANPNLEPLCKFGEKTFNLSEYNEKGQSVGGASQNQKSRTPAGLNEKGQSVGGVSQNQKSRTPAGLDERQPQEEFTDSSKEKVPHLFEMLTTPSNSSGVGVCLYGPNIDSHLLGAQKQFSPKTEKLHSETQHVSKLSAGITLSLAEKDNCCAEKANEQLATLSIKGSPRHNEESRLRNFNVNQDFSSKPNTETMDLDPLPFQPSRTKNQPPNSTTESPARTEPSDRWLKRLRHDVADPRGSPDSKRPKSVDCCPVGGASRMPDTDNADHAEARSVHSWVGRWCVGGGSPAPHGDPDQRERAAAKPGVATGELGVGGHFPSIKAMAMMGRVMSKIRPLDREKKGPCVMWKTEGA
ncbi:uncharacterized protein LOC124649660 [Lolium rigidum]|uniref:uncharacterized protein LOC124649660 n=1 Tax=Lolium rigidum TaxID=89674 RepID=UPI001F5DA0B2|nr:uncharacterized protein LOC124649660 [Lolium rigidum]XP_047045209.1 uncharacterized protein LOC124649660 [Lolium rigidum]XP_047045210.1 uncharacterized protein LOC124649660 [Lolium rigidum]XP_047045211.1 uncharacterized protein LOC124649660 [Lolium rigidum]